MIPLSSCLFFLPLLHSCFLTMSLICVCVCSFLERPNQIGELSEIWRAGWFYWAGGVMKLITALQHLQFLFIYPRSHANITPTRASVCHTLPPFPALWISFYCLLFAKLKPSFHVRAVTEQIGWRGWEMGSRCWCLIFLFSIESRHTNAHCKSTVWTL